MNVAFPALVLVFYVLPGIILRKGWSFLRRQEPKSIVDEIAVGVFWACILHAFWIFFSNWLFWPVDVRSALMHGIGQYGKDAQYFDRAIAAVQNNITGIVWYFGSINAAAFLLALGIRKVLRKYDLKKNLGALDWFDDPPSEQMLAAWSGHLPQRSSESSALPLLATIVDVGKTAYLYVGVLEHVYWNEDGSPDHFVLSGVMRRKLEDDNPLGLLPKDPQENEDQPISEADDSRFYSILGDRFIIRASEARTLNVLVRIIEDTADASSP